MLKAKPFGGPRLAELARVYAGPAKALDQAVKRWEKGLHGTRAGSRRFGTPCCTTRRRPPGRATCEDDAVRVCRSFASQWRSAKVEITQQQVLRGRHRVPPWDTPPRLTHAQPGIAPPSSAPQTSKTLSPPRRHTPPTPAPHRHLAVATP